LAERAPVSGAERPYFNDCFDDCTDTDRVRAPRPRFASKPANGHAGAAKQKFARAHIEKCAAPWKGFIVAEAAVVQCLLDQGSVIRGY